MRRMQAVAPGGACLHHLCTTRHRRGQLLLRGAGQTQQQLFMALPCRYVVDAMRIAD